MGDFGHSPWRTKHGQLTGPTRFGEHGSPSDGEIEIKSIFDGWVKLSKVAVSGNFIKICFGCLLGTAVGSGSDAECEWETGLMVRHGLMILSVGVVEACSTSWNSALSFNLGLVSYYRCFCRNFSTVVASLTDLLKTKSKYIWSTSCQQAFTDVKTLLCSAPVLLPPRLDQPFTLYVDASHVGAGAVPLQADGKGIEHPISFFSKKFNAYQLNYSVIEKEAFALVLALQHFNVYLDSRMPIVVFTDHNPHILELFAEP